MRVIIYLVLAMYVANTAIANLACNWETTTLHRAEDSSLLHIHRDVSVRDQPTLGLLSLNTRSINNNKTQYQCFYSTYLIYYYFKCVLYICVLFDWSVLFVPLHKDDLQICVPVILWECNHDNRDWTILQQTQFYQCSCEWKWFGGTLHGTLQILQLLKNYN